MVQAGRDSWLRARPVGRTNWTTLTGPQANFTNMNEGITASILESTGGGVPLRIFLYRTPKLTINVMRDSDNGPLLSTRNNGISVEWEAGYGSADGGITAPTSGRKVSGTAYLQISRNGDTEGGEELSVEFLINAPRTIGTF